MGLHLPALDDTSHDRQWTLERILTTNVPRYSGNVKEKEDVQDSVFPSRNLETLKQYITLRLPPKVISGKVSGVNPLYRGLPNKYYQ